jgi:metal-responsive CopG/Arc/MetJ family transcriptional regulator
MKKRLAITIEDDLLEMIDAEAARQRRSTSNLIEVALWDYLDRIAAGERNE